MKDNKPYSEILQEFIEPIVSKKDTEDTYFDKCLFGHVVWNYCISLEHELAVATDVFAVLNEKYLSKPETKKTVELLMERWTNSFKQYDRFISRIETRDKNGLTTLYIESVELEVFK